MQLTIVCPATHRQTNTVPLHIFSVFLDFSFLFLCLGIYSTENNKAKASLMYLVSVGFIMLTGQCMGCEVWQSGHAEFVQPRTVSAAEAWQVGKLWLRGSESVSVSDSSHRGLAWDSGLSCSTCLYSSLKNQCFLH